MFSLIRRGAFALGAFGLITAGTIAVTHQATQARIERNEQAVAIAALTQVLPTHDNDLLADQWVIEPVQALGFDQPTTLTLARLGGAPVGFALPVIANDGYSGPIHMTLGVNLQGEVTGLRVIKHKETPGLGDKIDLAKSDWILDFNGRSLSDPEADQWSPRPDGGAFDAFTGATITPRAVIAATARALAWYQQAKPTLLQRAQP